MKTAFAFALLLLPAAVSAQQVHRLDTLHVTAASRIAAAAALRSVDVIDRAAIEQLPAQSLADLIGRALGADVLARSPVQADLSLRGSTTEQVAILVDGVPVNDTQTGHFHLDQPVPLDDVERIEVLRGTASSVHGANAVGGIINIVTRARTGGANGSVRVEGGTFGTVGGAARAAVPLSPAGALTVSAEHARSDGHRPGTDYRTTTVRATLEHALAAGVLRVTGGIADRGFGAAQFYGPFPTSHEETRAISADASYDRMFGRVRLQPRASIRLHEDDFVLRRADPSFYRNIHATTDAGGALIASAPAGIATAVIGGEAYRSSIESTNLGDHAETRSALFGELAAERGMFTASAGARYDHSSTYGGFVSPSLAAGTQLTDWLRARASAARGFRAPTWTDRYYSDPANLGDSTLTVERAWTWEAGVAVTPASGWLIDGTLFTRHVDDAIDWVRPLGSETAPPWQIVNVQEARYRGVELLGRGPELGIVAWTVRASALSFDAESADTLESKYALRPLQETASLELAAPLAAGFFVALRGSHARRAGEASYHLLDARIRFERGRFSAHAGGTNLGRQWYADVSGAGAPGRAFTVGARWLAGSR